MRGVRHSWDETAATAQWASLIHPAIGEPQLERGEPQPDDGTRRAWPVRDSIESIEL